MPRISMSADEESQAWEASPDAEEPYIIAAIGAELERIVGDDRPKESAPRGPWFLPLESPDELLALLQSMPSGIGASEFASRLRDRFGSLSMLKAVHPEPEAEHGA
jgi:hypothetical protein